MLIMRPSRSFGLYDTREKLMITSRPSFTPQGVHVMRHRSLVVICAKKPVPFQAPSASVPKEKKPKSMTTPSAPKQQYLTEEHGPSAKKGKVLPKETQEPEKVESIPVETKQKVVFKPDSPTQMGAVAAVAVVFLVVVSFIIRVFTRKKPEPSGPSKDEVWQGRMDKMKEEMQNEFETLLADELAKKDAEAKKQLTEEIGKREANFDALLAAREREVRQSLQQEFETQLEMETTKLQEANENMQKENENIQKEIETKLRTEFEEQNEQNEIELKKEFEEQNVETEEKMKKEFEEQSAQIEMEWMKKLETQQQANEEQKTVTTEIEKQLEVVKSSQEEMKKYEDGLQAQLKDYEQLLDSLKATHNTELETATNGYENQISQLKEEIRLQELEIARRKKLKEEEEKEKAAAQVAAKAIEENGSVETEQQSTTVAVETLPPSPQPSPNGQSPPTHADPGHALTNGKSEEALFDAELRIISAGTTIPHVDKVITGGEDAFFVCSSGCGSIGVADGVGGWGADGIDPSIYSKELMSTAFDCLKEMGDISDASLALEYAHENSKSAGSATACVAVVKPTGILEVVNLGDCGVRVIRGSKCVFHTEPMYHEFNMPFQLGNPVILAETDWPCHAETYSFELRDGDLVVMGSDGLFDNLWNDDLTRIVNSFHHKFNDAESVKDMAKKIAEVAHFNMKQTTIRSPWAVQAASAGATSFMRRIFPQGGKMDDCTVVIGVAKLYE